MDNNTDGEMRAQTAVCYKPLFEKSFFISEVALIWRPRYTQFSRSILAQQPYRGGNHGHA